jgi:2,4-dienoyl-CoA reductase-like NADH-dependent reductase (Old Yellow Enzyme family)/thioredoxin reductase
MIMPAMLTALAAPDGRVSEQLSTYYEERAAGGVGLIIVESTNIEVPQGEHFLRQLSVGEDRFISGLQGLVDAIHSRGAAVALQICHQGRYSAPSITGTLPLSPSQEPPRDYWPESPAMDKADITRVVEEFTHAADRAQRAGFDAVELHGAHGYLICQFLSPLTNRRHDHYGGRPQSRARFLVEVVTALRETVGRDFPLILRLSADELAEGGITLDDTLVYAPEAERAGVDALHISVGSQLSTQPLSIAPMAFPPGCLVDYAAAVRRRVQVPVIAVGRINDPQLAERILAEGKADLVAMGRALIADPELPAKAKAGEAGRIRTCLACNYCIESTIQTAQPLRCAVNARAGRETEFPPQPASQPRRIWVMGGGPAGMEAARTARERGHEVRLYERSQGLGGQLIPAAKPPFKGGLSHLTLFLAAELQRLGVEVRLGEEAPHPSGTQEFPDAVVVATGSRPTLPAIPGIPGPRTLTALELLSDNGKTGDRVVVLGGERVGVEAAAYLAERGKRVVVTRRGKRMAVKMVPSLRRIFLAYLRDRGVEMHTEVEYEELREQGLVLRQGGREMLLPADTVVLATGSEPLREIYEAWGECGVETRAVGDCSEPRDIASAIREGFEAAYAL